MPFSFPPPKSPLSSVVSGRRSCWPCGWLWRYHAPPPLPPLTRCGAGDCRSCWPHGWVTGCGRVVIMHPPDWSWPRGWLDVVVTGSGRARRGKQGRYQAPPLPPPLSPVARRVTGRAGRVKQGRYHAPPFPPSPPLLSPVVGRMWAQVTANAWAQVTVLPSAVTRPQSPS